jgi:hypothetical protein
MQSNSLSLCKYSWHRPQLALAKFNFATQRARDHQQQIRPRHYENAPHLQLVRLHSLDTCAPRARAANCFAAEIYFGLKLIWIRGNHPAHCAVLCN